jgi:phosphoglycolate phosphatase
VITARILSTAYPCLDVCELTPDQLIGNVVGSEKAPGIRDLRVEAFIGDHPLDMEAARVAQVPGIGVTTGHHSAEELRDAGAQIVVESLVELIDELSRAFPGPSSPLLA